ncbi:MAG: Integrase, catalytic region [Micrococcaceae bacterium]|nr:Integrase, catalytic region [Micrococcaceae bacterium]
MSGTNGPGRWYQRIWLERRGTSEWNVAGRRPTSARRFSCATRMPDFLSSAASRSSAGTSLGGAGPHRRSMGPPASSAHLDHTHAVDGQAGAGRHIQPPVRHPTRTPAQVENRMYELRSRERQRPDWIGAEPGVPAGTFRVLPLAGLGVGGYAPSTRLALPSPQVLGTICGVLAHHATDRLYHEMALSGAT